MFTEIVDLFSLQIKLLTLHLQHERLVLYSYETMPLKAWKVF